MGTSLRVRQSAPRRPFESATPSVERPDGSLDPSLHPSVAAESVPTRLGSPTLARVLRPLLVVLVISLSPLQTRAQDDDAELAAELAELRLRDREARIAEGWVLVGYGGSSIAAGAVLSGIGAEQGDERLLAAGLGTIGWGAINALFSLFLMDLSGDVARDIEADRSARGADLVAAREDAARDQWSTATLIAVNAGLDVFYVVTGILLALLGDAAGPGDWAYDGREGLIGYGAAMSAQGAGLLIYDVVTWLFAQERGDRLIRMGR